MTYSGVLSVFALGVRSKVRGMSNSGSEVSADAKYIAGRIITHMWIIVSLPVLGWLLVWLYGTSK
jgi:hypothetical protein